MSGYPTRVDLSAARLVATGKKRSVYEHDDFPGMLIKVVRPDVVDKPDKYRGWKRWKRLPNRLGAFSPLLRELKEFLVLSLHRENQDKPWPIQRFWGFVRTDMGMGLVVERLSAPDGALAPTLHAILEAGQLRPEHRLALERLVAELERCNICIGNFHLRNMVFVGELGKGGRFISVDALGEGTFIPLVDWFPALNRAKLKKRSAPLFALIDKTLAARPQDGAPDGSGRARFA